MHLPHFQQLLAQAAGRRPNPDQLQAIQAPPKTPLFIVAGPGTGKTATLVLRMLRLVFFDHVPPQNILAVTFTRKAADELRSRLQLWGQRLAQLMPAPATTSLLSGQPQAAADPYNLQQLFAGTIDSLCQQLLIRYPGSSALVPNIADATLSDALLRQALLKDRRDTDPQLNSLLLGLRGSGEGPWNLPAQVRLLRTLLDRRSHDLLDWQAFLQSGDAPEQLVARQLLDQIFQDYEQTMQRRQLLDFPQLEQAVLGRLQQDSLTHFTSRLQAIFVDEYQDTNPLQEQLYFQMARRSGAALTVVGDDDQSLYRFRGATVDLFRDFPDRCTSQLGCSPHTVFLRQNYRSSAPIIRFVSAFAAMDPLYQQARVPQKPALLAASASDNSTPVLGLFRNSVEELATDLARFLLAVVRGPGCMVAGRRIRISREHGGSLSDCALLCSSPKEFTSSKPPRKRLPRLLREALAANPLPLQVFNPRGQSLPRLALIARLGGLLLLCLDHDRSVQNSSRRLDLQTRDTFDRWRSIAADWLRDDERQEVAQFVRAWGGRSDPKQQPPWTRCTPSHELLYALVHWLPEMQDLPDGHSLLQVFTGALQTAGQLSRFNGRILCFPDRPELSQQSVQHLLQFCLAPIAAEQATVDETLFDTQPADSLSILSIHQSKGLEFPLVIVDIGSDLSNAHSSNAFRRFPDAPGTPHLLEDLLRPFSPIRQPSRSGRDRAFDDLYRQYFVAFSRPQDVLVLTGLRSAAPGGDVLNIAAGRTRSGLDTWNKQTLVEI